MFAIISPEEYKTFLANKVPSTIPDKMKDHINTLASIDGEAFFTMAITTAGEHMIEYIDSDDVLAHDVVCKIDYMDFTYESINETDGGNKMIDDKTFVVDYYQDGSCYSLPDDLEDRIKELCYLKSQGITKIIDTIYEEENGITYYPGGIDSYIFFAESCR